jgi:hypothetical protein
VSQDTADQGEPNATSSPEAGESVPEIVEANVGDSGQLPNLVPFLAKAIKSALPLLSWEDPLPVSRRPSTLFFKNQESGGIPPGRAALR